MKAFDYLSSLILLFTAITLGELTMGLGYSLNAGTRATFYLPHTLITVGTFFLSVDYALRIYSFRKVRQWQFWSLIIVLIPGMVWLLGTTLLFPDIDPPAAYDFYEVFQSNKALMYFLVSVYIVTVNIAFALVYRVDYSSKLIYYGLILMLFCTGIFVNNEWLDYAIAITSILANLANSLWKGMKIKNEV